MGANGKIFDYIRDYKSVALAGLCKNAGKTTVLNQILCEAPQTEILALSSIGRDGEAQDIVTGTKKPDIFVRQGTLLATASDLLLHCDISREILAITDMATPLGTVVVLRALSDGYVQLAGPSITQQLAEVSRLFWQFGASRILIDGAVGRKSLCSRRVAEASILCAGASFGSMEATVAEAAHVSTLLQTPALQNEALAELCRDTSEKYIWFGAKTKTFSETEDIPTDAKEPVTLFMRGALTDKRILSLLRKLPKGSTLVSQDASQLLISASVLHKWKLQGGHLAVLDAVTLAAVTVNPYSVYGNSFPPAAFQRRMAAAVQVPVVDVIGGNG